jgi:carbonic anhydrase/acetyltransferase-like protein (isoleucine patch superfamily)
LKRGTRGREPLILPHHGKWPEIDPSVFVAPSADIVGEVKIGAESSVWFQVVVRGDVESITIGKRTNIQDLTMLHVDRRECPLAIGDEVTVGHKVTLHGCTVGNRVLIGMGATVMNKAVIGDDSIVAAGALVTEGKVFPPKSLIIGAPAKALRELKPEELAFLPKSAANYVGDSREYITTLAELSEIEDEDL